MNRYTRLTFLREILMIIATAIFVLPLYLLIVGSLKSTSEMSTSSAIALPSHLEWSNFIEVLTTTGKNSVVIGFINSVIITGVTLVLLILLSSMTAYVIVRSTRRWANIVFYLFLVGIILPTQLGIVPLYLGARALGLSGSLVGLIIIYTGTFLPLSVFLYATFFRSHPRDYEEAAALDGAGPFRAFWHAVLPLMGPVTATVAILSGLVVWNDFFTPLIFLGGSDYPTLPVVMYEYIGGLNSAWNKIFAVVIVALIPIMIFYMVTQKRLMQGFAGGTKE
ncbi:carbohydrate ABC transporter permease [Arthrobacter gengyunqii]|uniref:Carbohydrate ABC transporter permease n=1 Tax=Arthrobacter gengyunqii TaxID=2886940 RepID=A0A9X1S4A7_9MICC|nr:carbohydrate ABC transporter permease [Arthrobacter gengyunqii]MCC3268075.1 carbohydrate ABC transporter permease [Arthrobacter gengyunqii]UOY95493.1 carbohydrate ABC transporter permease [Arthrobacter gengyunqii]